MEKKIKVCYTYANLTQHSTLRKFMVIYNEYVRKIKEYMFRNNLTGRELSKMIGCHHCYLSEILNGRIISERLQWKFDTLFEEENQDYSKKLKTNKLANSKH